jgi:hypothetical protein
MLKVATVFGGATIYVTYAIILHTITFKTYMGV